VIRTRVGYAGGSKPNPTYHSLGDHTETIQIDFDPRVISYEALLRLFWAEHDPTAHSGSRQYMAAVFYQDESQRRAAEESKARLEQRLGKPVQTQILSAGRFTRAEEYHQKYYLRHERALMREFAALYPTDEAFVDSTAAARANGYAGGYGAPSEREVDLPRLGLSAEAQRRLREP